MTTLSTIPPFPALSDRAAGTYNSKAYAFGAHMGGPFVGEMNAVAGEVAANAADALGAVTDAQDAASVAMASSNYQGPWSGLSGAKPMGISASHAAAVWLLLEPVANVVTEQPGVSAKWLRLTSAPYVPQVFIAVDEKTSGTNGGASTGSKTWQTRDINTVYCNTLTAASLSANQITLGAGVYEIEARCPAYAVNGHRVRIFNVTSSSALLYGSASLTGTAVNGSSTDSIVSGRITLEGTTVLRLDHATSAASASGLGPGAGITGVPEIYSQIIIRRLA